MESPKKRKIFGKNGKCCLKNRQLVVESPASMPEDERERDLNFVQQALNGNGNAIEISFSSNLKWLVAFSSNLKRLVAFKSKSASQ